MTFEIQENDLYYIGGKNNKEKNPKLVITADKRTSILKLCHDDEGCHLGMEKTFYKVSERYYWKGMSVDIKEYIRRCHECQTTNKKTKTTPAEMQPVEVPKGAWKKIAIDLIGPFNDSNGQPLSSKGFRYVLTVVDYFSNYLEAFPLRRKLASEVTENLFYLFCRQGVPLELISDNGGEFNSLLTSVIEQQYGYKHIFITPYHPQSNGKCERINQSIKSMLNKTIQENESTWELSLQKCVFAYNSSRHSSTKYSPFYLMYWRNPVLANENEFGETVNTVHKYVEISSEEIETTVSNLTKIQDKITQDVLVNIDKAQLKQKADFDRRHNVSTNEFKIGEKVLVKNMKRKKNLGKQKWLGPYTIAKIPRIGTMTLVDNNNSDKVIGSYRQSNLKRYYEEEQEENEEETKENEEEERHASSDENRDDDGNLDKSTSENDKIIENLDKSTTENDKTIDNLDKSTTENDKTIENLLVVSDDNNNDLFDEILDRDIFITQSTFSQNDSTFDIDIEQMLCDSPKKQKRDEHFEESDAEPKRPKRHCQKDRRNSLYEYFPIIKKN